MAIASNPPQVTWDQYGFFATIFPQPVIALRAPIAGDNTYVVGQMWINTLLNTVHILTSFTGVGGATWTIVS